MGPYVFYRIRIWHSSCLYDYSIRLLRSYKAAKRSTILALCCPASSVVLRPLSGPCYACVTVRKTEVISEAGMKPSPCESEITFDLVDRPYRLPLILLYCPLEFSLDSHHVRNDAKYVAQMRSTLFSLTAVVALFCAHLHVAHAQYTVRIRSSFPTAACGAYARLFCFPVILGAAIDVRDLFLRFRLGSRPATAVTLPCRLLCSGCLQSQWGYVFSRISLSSLQPRSRLSVVLKGSAGLVAQLF